MGVVIRQSFKSLIVQYLGIVVGYFNIVWLFPKCLPLEEIGLIRFVTEMGIFLAFFAQIGVPNAVNRFYPYFRNKEKNDNGFQFWITVTPLIGIFLFSGIFILIKPLFVDYYQNNSPLVIDYFWYFIPFTFIYVYLNITEQYCTSQMRIVVPKLIRDVYLRAITSALLILSYYKYLSFDQLMLALCIAYFSGLVINILYIYKFFGINLSYDGTLLRDKKFRKEIRSGFLELEFAFSGEEALNLLRSQKPPEVIYIFSDINMPGMTGLELLTMVKNEFPEIHVSMVSAYGNDEYYSLAMSSGAKEFFTKPIDFDSLRAELMEFTGDRK